MYANNLIEHFPKQLLRAPDTFSYVYYLHNGFIDAKQWFIETTLE
jgi:hypothetical protein